MLHSSTVAANDLKQNVDLLLESDGVEFTLKFFSYDRLKSLVVNCAALTCNKATTRHKKAFRNAIWLWSDFKMHMFCSCYLTADKSLRHTTVQYNVWLWPPLPDLSEPKGSMQTSPVSKFYGSVASLHLPQPQQRWSSNCAPCSLELRLGARRHDSDFPWGDMFVTSRGTVWKNV